MDCHLKECFKHRFYGRIKTIFVDEAIVIIYIFKEL